MDEHIRTRLELIFKAKERYAYEQKTAKDELKRLGKGKGDAAAASDSAGSPNPVNTQV